MLADIVNYDAVTETYELPVEHSLCLTTNTPVGNVAVYTQFVAMAGETQQHTLSTVHCTPISLGQGGEGLGSMWGWETAIKMLKKAGFSGVERQIITSDPMNVWFVSRAKDSYCNSPKLEQVLTFYCLPPNAANNPSAISE